MERYSPWGRKGGGAPNDTVRMRNIQLQGLYPETKNVSIFGQDVRNPVSVGRTRGVGAGGGGAPIRSASGQIVTGLTDDPIISFNDANRYHVDNELRYKTSPAQKQTYRAELDRIVAEKENRARKTRSSELAECQPQPGGGTARPNGGPWGKPGPGGKPWRPPKNVGHNFMKSMGWTNKETLQDLDLELVNRMQRQLEEENRFLKRFSNCCSRCVCQCISNSLEQAPAPALGGSAGAGRDAIKYHPSPPATAPGGVELVPLLAKRRSQPRHISLGTTDVTKIDEYTANGSLARRTDDGYLTDLCNQMNQKQRKVETVRAMEFETSRQHFETWSSFWGRPGHGAPLPNKNKLNLDNLLYKSRR
uniref:Uncharacterized protein n=1 Tax=Anopheles maculatus TaxID=74869 RepID=A0A182SXX1_9DIPT